MKILKTDLVELCYSKLKQYDAYRRKILSQKNTVKY